MTPDQLAYLSLERSSVEIEDAGLPDLAETLRGHLDVLWRCMPPADYAAIESLPRRHLDEKGPLMRVLIDLAPSELEALARGEAISLTKRHLGLHPSRLAALAQADREVTAAAAATAETTPTSKPEKA